MTTATETPSKAAKRPKSPGTGGGIAASLLLTVALSALVSWLGGVALHRGFGVSVPFVAGLVLVAAFAFFVRLVVLMAASAWFHVAAESAFKMSALAAAGATVGVGEADAILGAHALLHMDSKIRDMSEKVDGGYL